MKKMKSHARDMCILMYLNFMSKKICKQTLNLVGMISTVLVMNSEALFFYSEIEKMYKYIVDNGSQIYHYSQRELYTEKARRLI